MLEGSSNATVPAGALSARYVAVKPCRVNVTSDVSRTKIEPDVDVIGGGAIVVQELAAALGERAGIDEIVVSEHDILDGIALSIPPR